MCDCDQNDPRIRKFVKYIREVGKAHVELQEDLQDTYELLISEIDDGGSIEHELELAYAYVEDELLCG